MSFLYPLFLAALPVIALPIIIHLVNQRRYQTMPWGAMLFLLAANRLSRGFATIRRWLILAMRVIAVTGIVVILSRPLSSGWLGAAAGGRVDNTVILLDRSPSMLQRGLAGDLTKFDAAKVQLARTLENIPKSRWVLLDTISGRPSDLADPSDLLTMPGAGPLSVQTDLPSLMLNAYQFINANQSARNDLWICSDLRRQDWAPDSGRWTVLRQQFAELPPGTRIHLLASPSQDATDLRVRVTKVVRNDEGDHAELLVSLVVERNAEAAPARTVPIQFEVNDVRTTIDVELAGARTELQNHKIPIESKQRIGWGRVSIPADSNLANNDFFFTFSDPSPPYAVVCAEDPAVGQTLQLAAEIRPETNVKSRVEVVAPEALATIAWEQVSLLLWQGSFPQGKALETIRLFMEDGGSVMFFPPHSDAPSAAFGLEWQAWQTVPNGVAIETWRSDADLLAKTQSGAALPVGALRIDRFCKLTGEFTELARLSGGNSLLVRVPSSKGALYACATTPDPQNSSLARDGVVFYVMLQRALDEGRARLATARQLDAGTPWPISAETWQRFSGTDTAISTEYAYHAGVYGTADRMVAVNRSLPEDDPATVTDEQLAGLFRGLDFVRIDERSGEAGSLVQEIWRIFLVTMLLAMFVEALLCLPRLVSSRGTPA